MALEGINAITYFAGFFDGEGSCGIYSASKRRAEFRVSLCQNNPKPLIEAQILFGGRIRPRYRLYRGRMTCNWEWYIHGKKADAFLELILPFLIVKKEQIEVYLSARKCLVGQGRPQDTDKYAAILEAEKMLKDIKRRA